MAAAVAATPGQDASDNLFEKGKERGGGDFRLPPQVFAYHPGLDGAISDRPGQFSLGCGSVVICFVYSDVVFLYRIGYQSKSVAVRAFECNILWRIFKPERCSSR